MQGPRRTLVLAAVAASLAALAVLPATAGASFLTPESPASPNGEDSQTAYIVVGLIATLVAAAAIAGLLAALRGRSAEPREPRRRTRGTSGVQRRIGLGLGLIATAVFVLGVIVTESMREVEPTGSDGLTTAQVDLDLPAGEGGPIEILASGQQWLWRYEYPDGTFSYYELVVPVNTAIKLDLESVDVLHSWWVPALGGMFEVSPGSDNQTWFKAEETGTYEGRSTIYSGPGYTTMRTRVRVVEPAEYEAWLEEQAAEIQEAQEAVAERIADEGDAEGAEEDEIAEGPEGETPGVPGQQSGGGQGGGQ